MSANPLDQNVAMASYMSPLRARPKGERAALGMGVGASVILALAALLTRHTAAPQQPMAEAELAAVAAPAKIDTKLSRGAETPAAATATTLDLDAPEFAHEKKIVTKTEGTETGGPIDTLTIGQFAMGGPFLRVDIHPDFNPEATNPDFFMDMTRHARAMGLDVAKINRSPAMVTTRFGAFETADIRLTQPASEGVPASERACLATRLLDPKASVEIAGIACGSTSKPIDRVALACVLDKLSYASGSDNKALNDFFLNAEIARGKGCANVSRDDLTASIPRLLAPASTKTASPAKKARAVARVPAIHPDSAKN